MAKIFTEAVFSSSLENEKRIQFCGAIAMSRISRCSGMGDNILSGMVWPRARIDFVVPHVAGDAIYKEVPQFSRSAAFVVRGLSKFWKRVSGGLWQLIYYYCTILPTRCNTYL